MEYEICDVCAGTQPTHGGPCICGGTGRMIDAFINIRRELMDFRIVVQTLLNKHVVEMTHVELGLANLLSHRGRGHWTNDGRFQI